MNRSHCRKKSPEVNYALPGRYVGYAPGFPGAHTQGETLDELNRNLHEVIEMLLEDGTPEMDAEFVGIQAVRVG